MGVFSVRKTTEQFVAEAKSIHGDKYDYSKVDYQGNQVKVCIICPIHGEFWQVPNSHLRGRGCPKCKCDKLKGRVFCVGLNDTFGHSNKKAHQTWLQMLERCGSEIYKRKFPTYTNVSVCCEWRCFSNFEKWYQEQSIWRHKGWHLDKDILVKGNKIYSPDTCCFVPPQINTLFTQRSRCRGKYPIGVHLGNNGKYCASLRLNGERKYLGYFDSPEEAFYAYKVAKEAWIKEVADKWKDQLDPRVYEAMYNYKVEITD